MEHTREHGSILAPMEKRLLIGIARRLPGWLNSDHLTLLAVAGMVVAGGGYVLMRWHPAAVWIPVIGLLINWFGDSLDGTVARVRGTERPRYGFYVDHVVDILGATLLFGGLAASRLMFPPLALSVLVTYLLVSAEVFLATTVRRTFKMSFAGVGPTELRILLALGTVCLSRRHIDLGPLGAWLPFDIASAVSVFGLLTAFVVGAIRNTAFLYRLEPPAHRPREPHSLTARVPVPPASHQNPISSAPA
jgi:archaetidylinositol phosphate synthase